MAKKMKRTVKDTREYAQTSTKTATPGPSTSAGAAKPSTLDIRIDALTQNELERLVDRLCPQGLTFLGEPPRQLSQIRQRLQKLQASLQEFGFTDAQIERVVSSGYVRNTTEALHYLLFYLPSSELPAIFAEGLARDERQEATKTSDLQVILAAMSVKKDSPVGGVVEENPHAKNVLSASTAKLANAESDDEGQINKNKEQHNKGEAEASHKAWLLRQYAYESDGSVSEDESEAVPPSSAAPSLANLQHSEASQSSSGRDQSIIPQSFLPEEVKLQEYQSLLAEKQANLNDEAANYMRSKHEVKELQKEVKQLQKQCQIWHGMLRKAQAQQQRQQVQQGEAAALPPDVDEAPHSNHDEDEEEPPSIGNIFAVSTVAVSSSPAEKHSIIQKGSIPSSWTGTTPVRLLNDRMKMEVSREKPQYRKLPLQGCKLRVGDHIVEHGGPSPSYRDTQQYVATRMLYRLYPALSLGNLLPPIYRSLWIEWVKRDTDDKQATVDEAYAASQARVDHLKRLLPASVIGPSVEAINAARLPAVSFTEKEEADVADDWEESTSLSDKTVDAASNGGPVPPVTPRNPSSRLTTTFLARHKTTEYQAFLQDRKSLPMWAFEDGVLTCIRESPVTIICAETGAGKTTQCPQYILEEALERGQDVKILCTQPRRVAATSVADRVSTEMCEDRLGGLVGYQIRLESKRSTDTRLLFCTTGVVLRRLVDDPQLTGVTHIIVDEVHERQWQIDVLLVALRTLIQTSRPDLKVILMSATLDAELFSSFFLGAPIIEVPGRTFPVKRYYLEDLLEATGHIIEDGSDYARRSTYELETGSLWVSGAAGNRHKERFTIEAETETQVSGMYSGYSLTTQTSMERVNETRLNFDLVEDVLLNLNAFQLPDGTSIRGNGDILIFLPGKGEIKALESRLRSSRVFGDQSKYQVLPLHSSLTSAEQQRVWRKSPKGSRKIIISTNVAETSITLPNVVVGMLPSRESILNLSLSSLFTPLSPVIPVIDSGRVRLSAHDQRTSTRKLLLEWCSRSSAKQRQGRAGRVRHGICLKLYSSYTETKIMKSDSEPELKRIPLEEVCLNVVAAGLTKHPCDFLGQAPQPPSKTAVDHAVRSLREIGAFEGPSDSLVLTPLGKILARLPLDCRHGKLLVVGSVLGCFDACATIVACLAASKSPFLMPAGKESQAKAAHQRFHVPGSDFLTLRNVYDAYAKAQEGGAHGFCRKNYLSPITMKEISEDRKQFFGLLRSAGLASDRDDDIVRREWNRHGAHERIVHAAVLAGMYPNVAHVSRLVGTRTLTVRQKEQELVFGSASVNAKATELRSPLLCYNGKFSTGGNVSISTTAFVHPLAALLFVNHLQVRPEHRSILLDGWLSLRSAGKTGVMFLQIREELKNLFQSNISDGKSEIVDGLVSLLLGAP